ncbi:MAG: hypothetical protein ACK2VA_14690 [Anaerolineae bacterium]|jgi:hypothetical protein
MRSPILIALFHPLNVIMLAASVAAGLLAAWWLLPVGLLLWAVMLIAIANEPEVKFRFRTASRAPLARRFQRYFDRIARAQLSAFNSLNAASPPMRRVLQPAQHEIDALTEQAHSLCVRMTTLENYRLVTRASLDPQTDRRAIDTALQRAEDPVVEREYADSQRALDSRARELDAITRQLDRVEAQLLNLANEMDAMLTELMRLQTLTVADAARYVPALVQRLQAESAELAQFERDAIEL